MIYTPTEWRFCSDFIRVAKAVVEHLQLRGYDAEPLVPEVEDISLKERVHRANKITCQIGHPVQETIIVSIHVNVAGNGKRWHNATGWCCYTYYGHSLSDEGKNAIIALHMDGIENFIIRRSHEPL